MCDEHKKGREMKVVTWSVPDDMTEEEAIAEASPVNFMLRGHRFYGNRGGTWCEQENPLTLLQLATKALQKTKTFDAIVESVTKTTKDTKWHDQNETYGITFLPELYVNSFAYQMYETLYYGCIRHPAANDGEAGDDDEGSVPVEEVLAKLKQPREPWQLRAVDAYYRMVAMLGFELDNKDLMVEHVWTSNKFLFQDSNQYTTMHSGLWQHYVGHDVQENIEEHKITDTANGRAQYGRFETNRWSNNGEVWHTIFQRKWGYVQQVAIHGCHLRELVEKLGWVDQQLELVSAGLENMKRVNRFWYDWTQANPEDEVGQQVLNHIVQYLKTMKRASGINIKKWLDTITKWDVKHMWWYIFKHGFEGEERGFTINHKECSETRTARSYYELITRSCFKVSIVIHNVMHNEDIENLAAFKHKLLRSSHIRIKLEHSQQDRGVLGVVYLTVQEWERLKLQLVHIEGELRMAWSWTKTDCSFGHHYLVYNSSDNPGDSRDRDTLYGNMVKKYVNDYDMKPECREGLVRRLEQEQKWKTQGIAGNEVLWMNDRKLMVSENCMPMFSGGAYTYHEHLNGFDYVNCN
jgi:hypothetical protein